ncbi:hypothetical protein ACWDTT_08190 [Streptosporangium sandarakinum]
MTVNRAFFVKRIACRRSFAVLAPYAWWAERQDQEGQGTLAPWRALRPRAFTSGPRPEHRPAFR